MRREDVSAVTAQEAKRLNTWSIPWLTLDPKDTLDGVLAELSRVSRPMILLILPAHGLVFAQADHFAALRTLLAQYPLMIRFVIPAHRQHEARLAEQYGFAHSTTVEEALQALQSYYRPHFGQTPLPDPAVVQTVLLPSSRTASPSQEATPEPPSSRPHLSPWRAQFARLSRRQRLGAVSVLVVLVLLSLSVPILLSVGAQLPLRPSASPVLSVGTVAFESSGQLDPSSDTGINDVVTITLSHLPTPPSPLTYYAWLLPDAGSQAVPPLLLGSLLLKGGAARLLYTQPQHRNLLAQYSGVRITEQPRTPLPTTPSLDPKTWRDVGAIPSTPTPGDEQHYSLLSHLRHLLAKDPTVSALGLAGGLDTWLLRNSQKLVEWATAARDSWAGSQTSTSATQLIHRQIIRILDYLDGQAFIARDVPPGTPWLVDLPQGRIGLLPVGPNQNPPAYLTHVAIHLTGVAYAPGHTEEQQQLAIQINGTLNSITTRMKQIHQDARLLMAMTDVQLRQPNALTLLNDLTTQATTAFAGQFDPKVDGNTGGITWVTAQLQRLAVIALKSNG